MLVSGIWLSNTETLPSQGKLLVLLIYCCWLYTVLHDCSGFANALVQVDMLTMTVIGWPRCRLCVAIMIKVWFGKVLRLVTGSWCVVHCPQVKGKGERRRAHRCEKELYNSQRDHAVCMWLLWKWTVFECDQGCIHTGDSVEKCFLNRSKRNKTGINIPEFVQ